MSRSEVGSAQQVGAGEQDMRVGAGEQDTHVGAGEQDTECI